MLGGSVAGITGAWWARGVCASDVFVCPRRSGDDIDVLDKGGVLAPDATGLTAAVEGTLLVVLNDAIGGREGFEKAVRSGGTGGAFRLIALSLR